MFSLYGAILTFCKCMHNHSINADMARNGNILQNSPDSWHHTANHVISYISGSVATWHHTANHVISYISGSVASWQFSKSMPLASIKKICFDAIYFLFLTFYCPCAVQVTVSCTVTPAPHKRK